MYLVHETDGVADAHLIQVGNYTAVFEIQVNYCTGSSKTAIGVGPICSFFNAYG